MNSLKVAVLGLGTMGAGMAHQLVRAGFQTTVWNRDATKATPLGEAGARIAATPAEATRDADVAVAMLANDDASRGVWLGGGALAALPQGAVAIESSTLTLDWVRELAAAASAAGVAFLDAPVTGSRDQAQGGSLKFLVGGDPEVAARVRPVLDAMGSDVTVLGPVGSGATLKLVNNFLCGVQAATLAEGLAMAEASGLDPALAAAILAGGAPGSPLVNAASQRMLTRDYDPRFRAVLMAKDLEYAERAFAGKGITLATAAAARARFEAADTAGLGDCDVAAVVEPLRKASSPSLNISTDADHDTVSPAG